LATRQRRHRALIAAAAVAAVAAALVAPAPSDARATPPPRAPTIGGRLSGGLVPGAEVPPRGYIDPLRAEPSGRLLPCPDPSVVRASARPLRYVLFCTSDNARNAFPIWTSDDLVHWTQHGFVFRNAAEPAWAVRSDGRTGVGRFWAPAVYRIGGRWVLYFAAVYNGAAPGAPAILPSGTMALGVATAASPTGPWSPATLLHYPGQDNALNPPPMQERGGGDIDPAVVRDPRTGARTLFWAEQREQIWEAALSPNGLALDPHVQVAFGVTEPWECDVLCTVEGPVPIYRAGEFFVLYSAASTWDGSYAVGVTHSAAVLDVTHPFEKLPEPILRSGNGFLGPGGVSDPVIGPDGREMIMYHALTHPIAAHISRERYLMLGALNWVGGWPVIGAGVAQ
jgi:beta-xylosidase